MPTTLGDLRGFAVGRSLFAPTSLARAVRRLGFVQADPIRAPARAQDLILRHRVKDYRAGDLERHYGKLGIEEDFFINYGFLAPEFRALMHPRSGLEPLTKARARQAKLLLAFVAQHGEAHPREVDRHFGAGSQENYWGGTSNATTRLLDALHYRGLLRVARRDAGIRVYAPASASSGSLASDPATTLDALIDVVVRKYAPLPAASLSYVIGRLRYGAPQWRGELKSAALRARQRLSSVHVAGTDWFWPAQESPRAMALELADAPDQVRLLAPFDPVVWDRRRFELLWGWAYRFEAYTPQPKRRLGYYALPLLWRAQVVGWANLSLEDARLTASPGYVSGKPPSARAFRPALEEELGRIERFLVKRRGG